MLGENQTATTELQQCKERFLAECSTMKQELDHASIKHAKLQKEFRAHKQEAAAELVHMQEVQQRAVLDRQSSATAGEEAESVNEQLQKIIAVMRESLSKANGEIERLDDRVAELTESEESH